MYYIFTRNKCYLAIDYQPSFISFLALFYVVQQKMLSGRRTPAAPAVPILVHLAQKYHANENSLHDCGARCADFTNM